MEPWGEQNDQKGAKGSPRAPRGSRGDPQSATALSTPLLPGPLTDVEKCFCALHHRGPKFEKQKLNVIMLAVAVQISKTLFRRPTLALAINSITRMVVLYRRSVEVTAACGPRRHGSDRRGGRFRGALLARTTSKCLVTLSLFT
jgi:hypothetical protein